jgi:uncharacterized DUF497 family protein
MNIEWDPKKNQSQKHGVSFESNGFADPMAVGTDPDHSIRRQVRHLVFQKRPAPGISHREGKRFES